MRCVNNSLAPKKSLHVVCELFLILHMCKRFTPIHQNSHSGAASRAPRHHQRRIKMPLEIHLKSLFSSPSAKKTKLTHDTCAWLGRDVLVVVSIHVIVHLLNRDRELSLDVIY